MSVRAVAAVAAGLGESVGQHAVSITGIEVTMAADGSPQSMKVIYEVSGVASADAETDSNGAEAKVTEKEDTRDSSSRSSARPAV